jgi:thiol-disulfide isomerase/thioredoxin
VGFLFKPKPLPTMKKIFILMLSLAGLAAQGQTLKGTITNDTIGQLVITGIDNDYKQVIPIDKDGNFSAKLTTQPGIYLLNYGPMKPYLLLSDKTNLMLKASGKDFYNKRSFEGEGSAENRLAMEIVRDGTDVYARLMSTMFNADREHKKAEALIAAWDKEIPTFPEETQKLLQVVAAPRYKELRELIGLINKRTDLMNKPAPPFTYKDVNGKMVSLSDFKGKYVLIDVWATWCTPCREEMPGLQKIEENLKDKNIAFLGVSIDKPDYEEKWKKMVTDKALGGTHLITEGGWECTFMKNYAIQGVPTYIIIDPDGNVVDPNAQWPRNGLEKQLKKLLE